MIELIERLEKATGPDVQLDMAVAMETNTVVQTCCGRGKAVVNRRGELEEECCGCPDLEAPHYTGSTDAALGLVPEGWPFHVWRDSTENGEECFAQVNYEAEAAAATHILALCIAALKARTAMKTGQALAASESG